MKNIKINTLNELKSYAFKKNIECKLLLNNGSYSKKNITFNPTNKNIWLIINHIDNSTIEYNTDIDFKNKYPLFFKAMNKGALILTN